MKKVKVNVDWNGKCYVAGKKTIVYELKSADEKGQDPVASKMPPSLKDDCTNAHNEYRSRHEDTPPMVWCEELAKEAQAWAEKIAEAGKLSHCPAKDRKGQGENIACCKGKPMTGRQATDQWYAEIQYFDFGNKIFGSKTGHFSQVVWKGSTELGAGIAKSPNGFEFCVARYRVAGNLKGAFEDNIGDLKGAAPKAKKPKLSDQAPPKSLKDECLDAHNDYRANHKGTPSMVWCDDLAKEAAKWANQIAVEGKMRHCPANEREGQGENIACCKGKPMTGKSATDQWYAEIKDFDFNDKKFNPKTGHFTQLVWKESIELGAAIAVSTNGFHFCVARYRVGGNLMGAYEDNIGDVLPQPQDKQVMDELRKEVEKAKPEKSINGETKPSDAAATTASLKDDCLDAHNEYRSKHSGTPSMVWCEQLAKEAQEWADRIAAEGKMKHCPAGDRKGQGENIACCMGKPMTGRTATDQWYSEIKDFDFKAKKFQGNTGHFTQVVWKESIELGAGIAKAANGFEFCVARYRVGGNLQGAFDANIGDELAEPLDKATMDELREKYAEKMPEKQSDVGKPLTNNVSKPSDAVNTASLKNDCLDAHNEYRSKHSGTPSMVWCEQLAKEAQEWADRIAAEGKMKHCPAGDRKGQGENIACCMGKPMTGRSATDQWYSEIKDFDFKAKKFQGNTGHFTQVVWKESIELGAGLAKAANGFEFCVARYRVGGNLQGAFDANIGDELAEPLDKATMDELREKYAEKMPEKPSDVDKPLINNGSKPAATAATTTSLKDDCLDAHNEYRSKHSGTPSMVWCEQLAKEAQEWADRIAAEGKMKHCPAGDRKGQGENIACCMGKPMTGRKATDQWYAEIKDFNFGDKKFQGNTGHFTQVVWKESIELGAGLAKAANGFEFCVARYRVGGNLQGAFDANIGDVLAEPLDKATMDKLREMMKPKASDKPSVNGGSKPSDDASTASLKDDCLDAHNEYRSKHSGTPSMVWCEQLAKEAQEWADRIAAEGKMKHCPAGDRKGQGENIACCKGKPMTGRSATDQWYSERKDFNFGDKKFQGNTGHFTQVVWKESIDLGAGIAKAANGFEFCVARYRVGGNLQGAFDANIGDVLAEPLDKATMDKLREDMLASKPAEKPKEMNDMDHVQPTSEPKTKSLREECLEAHNRHRSRHQDTPSMVWSERLANEAQKWANQIAAEGKMKHCPAIDRKGQGENIACCKGKPMTGKSATDQWYNEIKDFNFGDKMFGHNTGHFTQVVWKESIELGAAIAISPSGFQFCVARYAVPGNLKGGFDRNIGDPLSQPQDEDSMDKLREKMQAMQLNSAKPEGAQSGDALKQECLMAHNAYRAKHKDTLSMTWSDELAQEAQEWANHIAAQGKLAHCPPQERKGQGENIACCKGKPMTGKSATDQWYAEIKYFDFNEKIFANNTGHFTQVVWKDSLELGAATATSSTGFHFCVARYRKAGNIKNSYEKNIGDLK